MFVARLTIILLLGALLTPVQTGHAVSPTPQWVNFFSIQSSLNNAPLPVGAVIRAYDSSGIQCGQFVVHTQGQYGFLACYMDDPATSADEGVLPGDTVRFTVDGFSAGQFTLPGSLSNGVRFQVDLSAMSGALGSPCIDAYEPNDRRSQARQITGPEAHTFNRQSGTVDADWVTFIARAGWVYQIQARTTQAASITDPALRLYDDSDQLLAENDDSVWGHNSEIWWWNGGPEQEVFLQAVEANGRVGCRHYTLLVIPWNPDIFNLRFGASQ